MSFPFPRRLLDRATYLKNLRWLLDDRTRDNIGAVVDAELTPIGLQMLHLPMRPHYSRMHIEASRRLFEPLSKQYTAEIERAQRFDSENNYLRPQHLGGATSNTPLQAAHQQRLYEPLSE